MKKKLSVYLCTLVTLSTSAQSLYPGVKAPEIKVGVWVKGRPVKKFANNHIYVVEFWATWCGPCKAAIPHLTSLAKKYRKKVSVIGISVWEKNYKDVKVFVSNIGDKMNYNVAYDYQPATDPNSGFMAKNWLQAAEMKGIPATFIVGRKGTIEYIGYPDDSLDSVLKLIVNDKWDAVSYGSVWRNAHDEQQAKTASKQQQRKQQEAAWNAHPVKLILDRIQQLIVQDDYEAALRLTDTLEKMDGTGVPLTPPSVRALDMRMEIYAAQENRAKYFQIFDTILNIIVNDKATGGYMLVNDIIWKRIVDPNSQLINKTLRDYDFAVKWMKRVVANSNERDPAPMDTLAWAYFGAGHKNAAIETEKKALQLLAEDDPQRSEYENALKTFQQ